MADKLKDKGENRLISKPMRTILHALSYGNIEVEASRKLADLKKLDAMKIFWKKLDTKVYNKEYEVPIRLYFPSEEMMKRGFPDNRVYLFSFFFTRRLGDGRCGNLRPCLCPDGSVHRTDRSFCGIPPCP